MTQPNFDDWNQWAEAHVQRGLEVCADALGVEVAAIERRLIQRIESLAAELGELRASVEVERRLRSADNVVELPANFLRKSNAA